jgi:hypothetical protein
MKRFWSKIQRGDVDGCWIWIAGLDKYGYGHFWLNGRKTQAHRVSWIFQNGDIPGGMCVCHKCDNRRCVNPRHLFLGTRADNNKDCNNKGRRKNTGQRPGEQNTQSKLTELDIKAIRQLYQDRNFSQREIADRYGVSQFTISQIVRRKKWKCVL